MPDYPAGLEPQARACYDAGCHALSEPILIKSKFGIFKSMEAIASICLRCGAKVAHGFEWKYDYE